MPHVHVDFHEQGYNSPYYFAPAAEPFHEIITDWQRDFQTEIGKNHASYFDKEGWRYFTKESFDLLYPSYGDSYPTYMGAIGMTYEQAGHGRAGLGIITENNTVLTLKDRIEHHTTTGLSTVEVAAKNTSKMLEEFSKFFDNSNLKFKNYILRGTPEKIEGVLKLLQKYEIEFHFNEGKSVKAYNYETKSTESFKTTKNDLIIPTNQPKGKMVKVLFEQEAKLSSPITYDITAWSLPYAYGLQGFATENNIEVNSTQIDTPKITNKTTKNAYAYLHKWNEVSDAALLGDLLEKGFNVRFSEKDFSVEGNQFKKGSLIIMRGENEHIANYDTVIVEIADRLNKKLNTTNTGFVATGADFGSSSIKLIKNKKIAVLAGEGTSSLSFGEIWHFFETQLNYPLNAINTEDINKIDASKYQVLILPNGYKTNENNLKKLSSFASEGGTIIAIGSAVSNFADTKEFDLKSKKANEDATKKPTPNLIPFDQKENESIKDAITGSIFKSTVDASHSLAFGYSGNYYSLKQRSTTYQLLEKGYNVAYFPEDFEHISGYAGENALKEIPNSLLFGTERKGLGNIIYMVDNPLFRSFWENGKLFFVNAVFLN